MRKWLHLLLTLSSLICLAQSSEDEGFYEGIYCGKDNCYDVLGVTRDDVRKDIVKKYREAARTYHPDKFHDAKEKEEAEVQFRRIATAYEVLKDEESRKEYDYMLDNPELMYQNYYNYYRRRYAPKVDVRIVIGVSILVISVTQYWFYHHRHEQALNYLAKEPKYRKMALEQAIKEKLTTAEKGKRQTKPEWKEEQEKMIRMVLDDNMEIRGGYGKPKVTDVLLLQMILIPYNFWKWCNFNIDWAYRFWIKKEEFGYEEQEYLIKRNLQCTETQWEAIPEREKDEYFDKELWKKDVFTEWKEECEAAAKAKQAESGRYKMMKRYMKNHASDKMTFDPD